MSVNDRNYFLNEDRSFPLSLYTENYKYCIDGDGNEYYPVCKSCLNNKCPAMKKGKLQPLYVTDVSAESHYTVDLTITYSNGSKATTTLSKDNKYVIKYVEDGMLKQVVGVIVAIGKVNNSSNCTCDCCNGEDFLIKVDASVEYSSNTVVIRSSSIRDIAIYTKYADEDTGIEDAVIRGAALVGNVHDVKIIECTINSLGKVTKGKIVKGLPDAENCSISNGCAVGVNSKGHEIVVIDSTYCNGSIINGDIISGLVYEFTVEGGELDPETGVTTGCTVTAKRGMLIGTDITAVGGVSYNGDVIDPTIHNSTVAGGERTGSDMITTDGIAMSNIYYSGKTTGGILVGGIAVGFINDRLYQIEDGVTKGGFSNKVTVEGAIIEGGKQIGSSIIGATAKGGIATCPVSFDGTTVLGLDGIIKPATYKFPDGLIDDMNSTPDTTAYEKEINDLIVWFKAPSVGFGSNISVVTL